MLRLHDYLRYRAREHPEADFAIHGDRRVSYAEADRATNRIANALAAAEAEPGDRVALLAKNSIEHALFYYAASKAGVVPVPLNYRLAPPEWTYIAKDAGAKILFARGDLVKAIEPARSELSDVRRWVAIGADAPGWEAWDDFVAAGSEQAPDRHVPDDADVYQMYTSGTTGRPKGAVLTHRAVSAQLYQAAMAMAGESAERWLIVAPLYHAAAAVTAFACVQYGGCLYIQEDFDPKAVVQALSEERIALALLVPAMIQFCLLAVPDSAERSYDDLRLIVYGASPIAEETLRKAMEVFRCDFLQGYGMTETTAAVTYLMPRDHHHALREKPELLRSAGRPLLGTDVRAVDEEDRPLPPGEIGEIVARGPQIMRGYWNLDDATREALKGGWMHTGDAGRVDEHGYVYVEDRVKDMIVSGGENVYPREVEDVLFQHEAVADAAVIGVPSEEWGEEVKAVVVPREGAQPTEEDIVEFCKGRLAGYKRPRSVDFAKELPRNPTGKVLKRQLRDPYWKDRTRQV